MSRPDQERRKSRSDSPRPPFGDLARAALRRRLTGARDNDAHWVKGPLLTWVRWTREDGRYVYFAIRRRADHVTGEMGVSALPIELDDLPMVREIAGSPRGGCRIQLGYLLHHQDRWWSSGGSEPALIERLEWLAQQMQLSVNQFLSALVDPAA